MASGRLPTARVHPPGRPEIVTARSATAPALSRTGDRPARRLFRAGTPANNLLRFTLFVLTAGVITIAFVDILSVYGPGVDLEIPLRAAERWRAGGQPYLASSFEAPPGPDLPFLYPPVVLPFVGALVDLPRVPLLTGWIAVCAGAAAWTAARLRVPTILWPLVLMWPPFAEGIVGGNVQILLFAAFIALFYRWDPAAPPFRAPPADPANPSRSGERPGAAGAVRTGVLASLIAGFKVSQAHAWGYLLFRRPWAALVGIACAALAVFATLPITGVAVWGDWFAQVRRASEPGWLMAGIAVGRYVPIAVALALSAASVILLTRVPRDRPGVWVGALAVLGAPSLHTFGLLFLVPAMLVIRREVMLVAAMFIATYTEVGMWIGVALVIGTLVAGGRFAGLREPGTGAVSASLAPTGALAPAD